MWEHPTEDHQPEGLLQNENEYIYSQCNARQARSTQRNAHRFPFALPFVVQSTSRIITGIRPTIITLLGAALFRDEVLWVCFEFGFGVGFLLGVTLQGVNRR